MKGRWEGGKKEGGRKGRREGGRKEGGRNGGRENNMVMRRSNF